MPLAASRPALRRLAPVLAALLAAGCGSSAATPAEEATRTVRDAQGRTVAVPARPRRVVVLSEPTLDAALAVGLRPVATTAGRGQGGAPGYLGARARGIPGVGALGRPDLERVAALRPDLVLADGTAIQDRAVLDSLRRIAPTAYVARTGQDWRTAFAAAARVLGREGEGRRVLARFDADARAVAARLGANARARVSLVRWGGIGLPAVLKAELPTGRILAQLGLRRPAGQAERGPGHTVPVSLERLDQVDGDWMFLGALGTGAAGEVGEAPVDVAAARTALRHARQTPGWGRLEAVRRDRVVPVDASAWMSAGGPLAARIVLRELDAALAAPTRPAPGGPGGR